MLPAPYNRDMPRSCSSCGTENPAEARFCLSCGSPFDERGLARLERKFATALFADLVGYTSLTEQQDPEVVRSLVGQVFDRLVKEIERYDGLVEKFIGDAVLAVFGVPTAHEDDPERAVRAALDMQAILSDLNERFAAEGKPHLGMRIGIEAGEVLVDLDRVARLRDRMVTGDAVNTAARLQQATKSGGIVVGPNVHAATKGTVDYGPLSPIDLKGKTSPVPAWEVRRLTAGGERARLGLQARLIGRDEELAVLTQSFHRVEKEGSPALVAILGPAGVGKSRLALELSRYLAGLSQRASLRKGRCLAYGNVSYSALAQAVKAECGILEDDSPESVRKKVARTVEELFGDREHASHVEALVGSGKEHAFRREELFDAWLRFLERMAARSSLVLLLEDLHWADDGLLDFIEHVADWAQGPIFLLTLARPTLLERRPGWGGGKRNYATLSLDPLTPEEVKEMLEDLLSAGLPETFTQLVVERSEGNPLFGEEIVRMFIDRGVLRPAAEGTQWEVGGVEEVEIPRSVQALIAARLDALPKEEKAILQDAAVVGRTFWVGAAKRLSGHGDREVREALGRLRAKEIVVPREPPTFSGEVEFAFRHILFRDVAYESLPKSFRADKHVEVAKWAEEQAGERGEEIAELLAMHYVQAIRYLDELGETDGRRGAAEREGYRWARAAGHRSRRLWQQREAVRWLRTALELADRAGATDTALAALWESYADACQGVEPYREVEAALEKALALYEEQGSPTDLGRVEARLAYVAYQSGQEEAVIRRAERALARLEPLGDSGDLALALCILGQYHRRRGQWEQAERHLRRAMTMAERVRDPVTQGRAMVWLGSVLQAAEGEAGTSLLQRALDFARQSGDLSLLLRALVELSEAFEQATGDYRQAEALLREGIDVARRAGSIGEVAWMEGNLADYLFDMGRLDEEVERLARNGLQAARALGEATRMGYSLCAIALIHTLRGEMGEAEETLHELRDVVVQCPDPYIEAWEAFAAGLLAQAGGKESEAARILSERAQELGDRLQVWGGQNLLLECVRCLVRAGRAGEALPFRDRLEAMAATSVPATAFLTWAEGLLDPEPAKARQTLSDAVVRFEALERRIELGRCLIDLADAERWLGRDPKPMLARSREILESCGATLFLGEVERAGAAAESAPI